LINEVEFVEHESGMIKSEIILLGIGTINFNMKFYYTDIGLIIITLKEPRNDLGKERWRSDEELKRLSS
jgi:hypothetical protein